MTTLPNIPPPTALDRPYMKVEFEFGNQTRSSQVLPMHVLQMLTGMDHTTCLELTEKGKAWMHLTVLPHEDEAANDKP